MLGALLEATGMLSGEQVTTRVAQAGEEPRWIDIDLAAMARGREEARKEIRHEN